jgi:hypothetical protein
VIHPFSPGRRQRIDSEFLDFHRSVRKEEIQGHRKIDLDAADERFRRGILQLVEQLRVLMEPGDDKDESDVVFSSPSRSPRHLVKIRRCQI